MSDKVFYGMYSKEQRRDFGSCIYESLDRPGENIEVTEVCTLEQFAASNFKDKQNLGRVGDFVRIGRRGKMEKQLDSLMQ